MNEVFSYSILQYKHSLVLGESLNVGILFYFPKERRLYFSSTNTHRPKSIYTNFDNTFFTTVIRGIKSKVSELNEDSNNIFSINEDVNLKDIIYKYLFPQDSNSLLFTESVNAISPSKNTIDTVESYAKLLLIDHENKKEENRHNEPYIIKQYTQGLTKQDIVLEHKVRKNLVIEAKGLKLNFDIAWKNGTTHLVKPIGFDLKDGHDITKKSAEFYGYFDVLTEYATVNKYHFDLLVSKPQDQTLIKAYNNALDILSGTKAPKKVVTEDKLAAYVEETAYELKKKDLEGNSQIPE